MQQVSVSPQAYCSAREVLPQPPSPVIQTGLLLCLNWSPIHSSSFFLPLKILPVRGGWDTDATAGRPLSLDSLSSTLRIWIFRGRRLQRQLQLSRRRAASTSHVRAVPSARSAFSSSPLAV